MLAGDIGGTNTNLALVVGEGMAYRIVCECVFRSREISGLNEPLRRTLAAAKEKRPDLQPDICCLSGAGPVNENVCQLSNLEWDIDGNALAESLGMRVLVVNDFLAISYGVPLLDVEDEDQITQLPHTDRTFPKRRGNVSLIVGAGTGLGVGFTVQTEDGFIALPSEGGHASFADFDNETAELKRYMTQYTNFASEIELFVSGTGITNIYQFFRDVRKIPLHHELREIEDAADEDKPGLVGQYAEVNPVCRDILRLFIKVYGRITADFSAILLPTNGIYLAGGIVSRNERHFLDGMQFIYYFEQNFRPNIAVMLKRMPVYIIREYSISLLGAAHAGVRLGLNGPEKAL